MDKLNNITKVSGNTNYFGILYMFSLIAIFAAYCLKKINFGQLVFIFILSSMMQFIGIGLKSYSIIFFTKKIEIRNNFFRWYYKQYEVEKIKEILLRNDSGGKRITIVFDTGRNSYNIENMKKKDFEEIFRIASKIGVKISLS